MNSRRTVAGESLLSGAIERSGMEALRMLRSGDAVNISDTGKHQASSGSGCPEAVPRRPLELRLVYGHSSASWLSFLLRS